MVRIKTHPRSYFSVNANGMVNHDHFLNDQDLSFWMRAFTAAMGALREKNCDLAHLLKVQEIPQVLLVVVGDNVNALTQNDKSWSLRKWSWSTMPFAFTEKYERGWVLMRTM